MKRFNFIEDNTNETIEREVLSSNIGALGRILILSPFIIVFFLIYVLSTSSKPKNIPLVDPNLQETLSKTIELYNKKNTDVAKLVEQIPVLKQEQEKLRKDILEFTRAYSNYISIDLAVFLKSISSNIPMAMALTKLELIKNKIIIAGISRDNDTILAFIEALTSKGIVKLLNIKYSNYTDSFGPYKQDFLLEGTI